MRFKILFTILLLPLLLTAENENTGTTGFAFLKVSYSARASAMGGAFSGLADDASAVFFNPAGLNQLKGKKAEVTYMNYLEGVNCGSAVYAYPYNEETSLAVFVQGLSASEDKTLVDAYGQYAGKEGTFGVSDFLIGISFARKLHSILDAGINIKYLLESLDGRNASVAAFDIGLMHQTTNENLKVGIVLRNIGKQLSYYTETEWEEELPMTATLGFNLNPIEQLHANLDIYKPLNSDFSGKLGLEYTYQQIIAFRCGYKSNASDWKAGGDNELFAGLSLGFGLKLYQYNLKMDYALVSYGDLGYVNQITIGYSF
jgi:hypothetical protein